MNGKTIVHGHTPMTEDDLKKYNNKYPDKINLDSACVFGYNLTARDLTNNTVFKVVCRDRRIG